MLFPVSIDPGYLKSVDASWKALTPHCILSHIDVCTIELAQENLTVLENPSFCYL